MNYSKADTATDNLRHHPRFFMEPLFVQIKDILFQIPRVAFEGRKGSPFADAASLPAQQSTDPVAKSMVEGRSADKPVILPVEVTDFENLLHVMYAFGLLIPDYPTHISKEEWISALRLATLWNFDDIRNKAIKALDSSFSNPMERLCVARAFRIRSWLVSSYVELITGPISALQPSLCSTTLGWETLALIHHARNEYGTGPSYNPTSLVQHLNSGISSVGYKCSSCNPDRVHNGRGQMSAFASTLFPDTTVIHQVGSRCPHLNQTVVFSVINQSQQSATQPVVSVVPSPSLTSLVQRVFADELAGMGH
ncbi:hypothetical protein BJ165DRAFT_289171 [Panaeolus papilionaceus]|nr:hypothetical protein BJ165DRAFT_289171 [Panaeolus papilionaceus]